jgi:AraC-like DNA-binding protein
LVSSSLHRPSPMRLDRISPSDVLPCGCKLPVPLRTRHSPGEVLTRHRHDHAYAGIVLRGAYVEAGDSGRHRVEPADVLFHRPFESHLDRFGVSTAEVLNLPLPPGWTGPAFGRIEDPDSIVRLAERDVREAIVVLTTNIFEHAPAAQDWPDLLAAELLRDTELKLEHWSAVRGLHRGSISRGFRQQFGITPAEFRSLARAHKAVRRITELPLSELAAECGFADQAHMSRAIKKLTGLSPGLLKARLSHRQ